MKHATVRKKLNERLDELIGQIGEIEAHLSDPLEKDSEERSIQLEHDEVLGALDDAGRRELLQVRAALKRLEDGSYGACEQCGESISTARLEAVPATDVCIHCAEKQS